MIFGDPACRDCRALTSGNCGKHGSGGVVKAQRAPVKVQLTPAEQARFWSKVERTDTCWLWRGQLKKGYGFFRVWRPGWPKHGKNLPAYRLAYELENGLIPDGFEPDHLCRVRPCVRHDHLEAVTKIENLRRADGASGLNSRKTACPQGHAYRVVTVLARGRVRQWRRCPECETLRKRVRRTA